MVRDQYKCHLWCMHTLSLYAVPFCAFRISNLLEFFIQMLMSVPEALTIVIEMPHAPTLWEITTAPVMRDMKEVALKMIA